MANQSWRREILCGHIAWGFTGWADARTVAVRADRYALGLEVLGHYLLLYRPYI